MDVQAGTGWHVSELVRLHGSGHRALHPGTTPALRCYWALKKGVDPASVTAFLNHKSPSTTRRFYATHAVPAKIPTLA